MTFRLVRPHTHPPRVHPALDSPYLKRYVDDKTEARCLWGDKNGAKEMSNLSQSTRSLRGVGPARKGLPKPSQEGQRLEAVTGLNQIHSENQPALIALRNTAQALLRTPVAFIGFIEEDTQRLLTVCVIPQEPESKAAAVEFKEMLTPRDCSICQYLSLIHI